MIKNQIKTVFFLALLTGLLLGVGQLVGGRGGLTIALFFAVIMNFGAYWWSDKIVLAMYRAKPVTEAEAPKLYSIVREVSSLANIPMPKVYVLPTAHSNAFATGRSPGHSAVAFTQGILNLLNDNELKGVIAHELSHIKNRDTLIQVVAATIAGIISFVAFMARWAAIFGGMGGRDRNGGGILELLVLAIVTPIIATLIQLAISRSREYLADESAAKTLHDSEGLVSALGKIHADVKFKPLRPMSTTQSTAHLFIANPFKGSGMLSLFMTHPPMEKRISRLKEIKL